MIKRTGSRGFFSAVVHAFTLTMFSESRIASTVGIDQMRAVGESWDRTVYGAPGKGCTDMRPIVLFFHVPGLDSDLVARRR
ncbi:hypothetical protein TNIN_200621 [Trichonephila inaurata madagascariensis]|uniref:Uncharacterized protein n=1 Tax=Trichonephila inaurata madagascariensis TaxID=2747483 RepID=A0A8X6X4B4_9ARAC|nr:hypothetical protein TNIN_200621 [Trichonephila inaurata madagascariensis]